MSKPLLTVWYNTRCPVCDAGISRQKRRLIEAVKAGRIEFRDINAEPAALAGYGIGLEDIRRRLHAIDADGKLLAGVVRHTAMATSAAEQRCEPAFAGREIVSRPFACPAIEPRARKASQ
ncbi:DCC1-like thiol-disulfide oxidoreductase family protein [Mesorhizobium sp. M0808]|uniref:DCC1-like thiol-disulfide oxidoreductase family protein n=1 Tax=Mesorhizobium sp. M0808 TaxID=2957002 RepID=UPI003334FABA